MKPEKNSDLKVAEACSPACLLQVGRVPGWELASRAFFALFPSAYNQVQIGWRAGL